MSKRTIGYATLISIPLALYAFRGEGNKVEEKKVEEVGTIEDANLFMKEEANFTPFSENKQIRTKQYIDRYHKLAIGEMKKYGIPASIILAQGLLESDAGRSRLALNNNNHFGVKCFAKNCPKGHCTNFADDSHKDFFRKYNNTWESYRAHSELLTYRHYRVLFKYGKDYRMWAIGLKKLGYATDKYYAETLINIIEENNLSRFDK